MNMTTVSQMSSSLKMISLQSFQLQDSWKRCMALGGESHEMTQSEFFKKYIPTGEEDFTTIFHKFNLGEIFTSKKVVLEMSGSFNCNNLLRQTLEVPHILIYSDHNYMVFQPLGEPGRDILNLKIGHLIVMNHNSKNRFTLSEMLPLSYYEKEDLKHRSNFLKMAYNSLFKNMLAKDCGEMVRQKVIKCGLPEETPIREFFAYQIMNLPENIKSGRPGYKLTVNGSDISNDRQRVNSEIARVFNSSLKISQFIQGPSNCSQLVSHIHGFLYHNEGQTFDGNFYKTYINVDHIISVRFQSARTPPRRACQSPSPPPRLSLKKNSWCCGSC